MDFSVSSILAGLFFGTLGFGAFRHGRRNANPRVMSVAMALMVYPYFIENAWLTWGIGGALCLLLRAWWW